MGTQPLGVVVANADQAPQMAELISHLYQFASRAIAEMGLEGSTLILNTTPYWCQRLGRYIYGRSKPEQGIAEVFVCPWFSQYEIKDTILHELAHIKAYRDYGVDDHGPVWQSIYYQYAERLGLTPMKSSQEFQGWEIKLGAIAAAILIGAVLMPKLAQK